MSMDAMDRAELIARLKAVETLTEAAWAGDLYVLPGGYPSRPVEAFDLRNALNGDAK